MVTAWKQILDKRLEMVKQTRLSQDAPPLVSYKPVCQLCGDRGVLLRGNYAVPCQCMKQKTILNRFKFANISQAMRRHTFTSFNFSYYSTSLRDNAYKGTTYYQIAKRTYEAAQEFVNNCLHDNHARGLMFCGQVGSGKTFLASAIANALLEAGKQVLFSVVPDLLDEIKATYSHFGENELSELQLVEMARKVEILILDDLGAHNYTDWTRNKLYTILNYRLNNELPTVITTNLELDELEDYLGERTTSRIIQLCSVFRLLVEKDIRYLRSKEKK
jgi:DNA replication protein DnaC